MAFTREEYLKKQKEKEKEVESAFVMINEKLPSIFSKEEFTKYLNFMLLFHNYSYLNIVLLYAQKPDATYVAGFNTWRSIAANIKPGIQIIKESSIGKGLKVLIPFTKENLLKKNTYEYELIYSVVSLYDISQTNDLPSPKEKDIFDTEIFSDLFIDLVRGITGKGIYFKSSEKDLFLKKEKCYISPNSDIKAIFIREGLSPMELKQALISCAVDCFMKKLNITDEGPKKSLIRESSIYCLLSYYRFDVSQYSFSYIDHFRAYPKEELKDILNLIQQVTHMIIIQIDHYYRQLSLQYISINDQMIQDI